MKTALSLATRYFQEFRMSINRTSGASQTSFTLDELVQAAEVLQVSGKHQEAIDMYSQWLKHGQDERKHVAWFNYGWLLQKANKVAEASKAYDQLTQNYANYLSGSTAAHA
jgi:tetratricopeptide (TPR) repeat protein